MEREFLPFSQRMGLAPVPPQLKIGEVSDELRRLLFYRINSEIEREERFSYESFYFRNEWKKVAEDLHVVFFGNRASTFKNDPHSLKKRLEQFSDHSEIGRLFDLVEFLARHPVCSKELKNDLAEAFVNARAAYRIVDSQIVAIGTEQQGAAFERSLVEADRIGAGAARHHLVAAGLELRRGDWAGSVRESIHAVESMAIRLAPDETSLGAALRKLEQKGRIHGSLKQAFGALYGYSSDEKGVRHALVFEDKSDVNEADALFMLGACASFVSYLIASEN
jgi:hypothetical protein